MIRKAVKVLVGILLLPVAAGFAVSFYELLVGIRFGFAIHPALVYGFLAYVPVHLFLHRSIMTYGFAHELTHALWAVPFGGRLKDFRVGESGGQVVVTRTNALVLLAPYFFPLFAYLLFAAYGVFAALGVRCKVFATLCFPIGFFLSFHLLFSGHALLKKQSDLKKSGRLLSAMLIPILNILFIVLILKGLAPGKVGLVDFFRKTWENVEALVSWVMKLF